MHTKKFFHTAFRIPGTILVCFFMALFLPVPYPVSAQEPQTHTIKVGRFPYEEQLAVDKDGSYSGYGYDYLKEIARYTNWRYEFLDASWSDCLSMLERGEIDLMGAAMRSPDREAHFSFSDLPMLSGHGVLATSLENQALAYEDFENFDGLKVGVIKNNLHHETFLAYSREHDFMPIIQEYDSEAELNDAMASGEVEAIIMTNNLRSSSLRIIAAFGETSAYFITTKGNTQVLNALNQAMRQIQLENPYFNSKLDQKYYDLQTKTAISFTRQELDFIKNSPAIPCTYVPNAAPVNSYDESAHTVCGISVEVCNLLEERTGLTFQWINPASSDEAIEMVQQGKALLLAAKYDVFNWAEQNHVTLTEPYLLGQMVMITNESVPTDTVALYNQDSQSRLVAEAVSADTQMKLYPSIHDCIDAVLKGEASTTYANSTIASFVLNNPKYSGLHTTPLYGFSADVAMAVSDYADPLLLSVLNKGLRNISSTEMNEIILAQRKQQQGGALATYLYLHPVEIISLVTAVFLALIIVLYLSRHAKKKATESIQDALYMDSLTGHPNYYAFVQEATAMVKKHPEGFAMIYLDIHRFKAINDTFGYEMGDQILLATSDLLLCFLTPEERFARVHADIFALLLKYNTAEELRERLDVLASQLEHLSSGNFHAVNPIFCGGVYLLRKNFDTLDRAFDRANYAKSSLANHFSNIFVFYDDIMRNQALNEKSLESSMQTALDRGEFIPYYQPKVDALTGKVIGAEALVRWHHPEKGCLSPGAFLPFYEKNGFIVKIDLYIFELVCRDMHSWNQAGYPPIPVSVNFSRRNIQDQQLPKLLYEIAARYQIPTNLLEIEITETEELENTEVAVNFVNALRSYGFCISIDDYGTGYSSISFLQILPLNTLKLDRQFVMNAMQTTKAKDIMRNLVSSMQRNNIRILCEGIETAEQRDFAISLNCRYIQGFLYSTPLPRKEFEAYFTWYGVELPDDLTLIPMTSFKEVHLSAAEDFLNQALPSWIVCCLDEPDYPVQYISPNFLEGMGYSELEFKTLTKGLYMNWIHPDDRNPSLELLKQAQPSYQNLILQYRIPRKNGEYAWIREISKYMIAETGQKVIVSICTDITDLVLLQQEKSQLIDTIPGGVGTLCLTPNGPIIQQASEGFYHVIGYTQEEMALLDNNLGYIFYEQDLPRAMDMIHTLTKSGQNFCECNFRIRAHDNSLHWVTFRGTMSRTSSVLLATAIIFNNDAEMLKQKEASVSHAKLELALALTEHSMFEYDIKAKTITSHSGFSSYGIPDGMILSIHKDMIEKGFIHPDDIENFKDIREQIVAGEHHISYEIRIRSNYLQPNAPYLWVKVTLTPIYDEDQQPMLMVGVVENIHERKENEKTLIEEATKDPLTGVLNRMAGEQQMQDFLSGQTATGTQAFLMLDLDQFKMLNDTCGHQIGDQYLTAFAKTIRAHVRSTDIVARMGGDEFAILLTNLPNEDKAVSIAEKIRKVTTEIGKELNIELETGTSIGIATAPPLPMSFTDMYRYADEAMYAAKKNPKIHVAIYDE